MLVLGAWPPPCEEAQAAHGGVHMRGARMRAQPRASANFPAVCIRLLETGFSSSQGGSPGVSTVRSQVVLVDRALSQTQIDLKAKYLTVAVLSH